MLTNTQTLVTEILVSNDFNSITKYIITLMNIVLMTVMS